MKGFVMTVYENYFEVTEKLYCEAMNKMIPAARFVLYGIAAVFLGVSAIVMFVGKNYITGFLWLVLSIALAVHGFFGITMKAKRFFASQLPSICDKDGVFWKRSSFSEGGFRVSEPRSSANFKYSDIQAVNESRNLYVIILKERKLLFVKKGCFNGGTDEEFIAFLRKKCHAE